MTYLHAFWTPATGADVDGAHSVAHFYRYTVFSSLPRFRMNAHKLRASRGGANTFQVRKKDVNSTGWIFAQGNIVQPEPEVCLMH